MNNVSKNLHSYYNNYIFLRIFHGLMWVTFEFIWLKCDTFSIIQAVMQALIPKILQKVSHTQGCKPF